MTSTRHILVPHNTTRRSRPAWLTGLRRLWPVVPLFLALTSPSLPAAGANPRRLGPLVGADGWETSGRKGKEAPASPQIVHPGLSGSSRAAWFRLFGYDDPGNTSVQHAFTPVSGERITAELTVKPSSELRGLGVAVRGRGQASAYIRFNGKKKSWCQHYDHTGAYRDIAPFRPDAENRLKIEVNTVTQKIRGWVNGRGGNEWPFRAKVGAVDRIDLFMTHGNGPEVTAWVDDIVVRDDSGNVLLAEDFERYAGTSQKQAGGRGEGRVRVSANPHWLKFRGQPILPIGDSITHGWMEQGTDLDQRAYLDALAARGLNAVLLWSYTATRASAERADPRVGYDSPEVWPWKGSPEDASFDLQQFNPAYFARLREFVKHAANRNILVVLTVQDGWPKTKFARHPFNGALGNGPLNDRKQLVELADYENEMPAAYAPDWTWQRKNQYFQERYAEKLCSELQDCTNLIFEMFNEGEWYDREQRRRHEEHFLRFFRKRTAAPLMTNTDHVLSKNQASRTNPAVDILSFHKKPWTGHYEKFVKAFRDEPARVIMESEPVPAFGGLEPAQKGQALVTPDILRQTVWERALAGAGFVAQNDTSFGWNPKCGMAAQAALRDQAYDLLGHAARFFNQSGVRFWEMAPHPECAGTGRCLAQPGVEYVVYAPTSGVFTVDLAAVKGKTLTVRWYDPRTGRFHPADRIAGGDAAQKFTPPFAGDAVLHLRSGTNTTKQDR